MAWVLTLVAAGGTPVNVEIPREHTAEQVEQQLVQTPPGQWAIIYGIVDGAITKMHIRPDQYAAFFTHFVEQTASEASARP
ncbi:hypothetical protein [Mycolicibacterium peregrinum]|uniref:hypothetical protein n=1 Tax=Mycolicibacterium peregrinum TaxID=43304 RepID=UPI000B4A96CA|nr:hypothetical protein [Mycolicibacterium peregrinum]